MKWLLFGTFGLLFALRVPVPFAFLCASALYLWVAGIEPAIAAQCPRAIRMSDGRIVDDGPGARIAADLGAISVPTAVA